MASTSSVGNASSANASSAQAFYTHFRAATDSLLAQLTDPSTGSDSLQQALAKYASLSAELTQAVDSGVLPSHDQGVHKRRLEEVSAALEQRRRALEGKQVDKGEGKKRGGFAFKRKQPAVASAPIPTPSATAASEEVTTATERSSDEPQPSRQSSHLTISTLQATRYTHPTPSTTTSQPTPISVDLTNISHSIVDLRSIATTHTILAVQIRNVHSSAILLPHIEGSVMVHDVRQSVLGIASCHQFRMHVSKDTVVQLETKRGSVVTIEGCSGVRFVMRSGAEEIRVQDFDDLINSEGLRSAEGGQRKGNFSVVKGRGDEGVESRIDVMSGSDDDIKVCIDHVRKHFDSLT